MKFAKIIRIRINLPPCRQLKYYYLGKKINFNPGLKSPDQLTVRDTPGQR